jgi:Glycosyltransferase family 17
MLLLLPLLFLSFYTYSSIGVVRRTADLQDLLKLLNADDAGARDLFINQYIHRTNPGRFFEKLAQELTPWIVAEPDAPITSADPPPVSLNCSSATYSNVFDGSLLAEPRVIVDFVPFGYDLDKLEARLYEGFDIVTAFVLYEAPLTQTGKAKPFYFDMVRNSKRFNIFSEKIIYLKGNSTELQKYLPVDRKSKQKNKMLWKMEGSMRFEVIRLLKKMPSNETNFELKERLIKESKKGTTLGIQNDADEMITRTVRS